MSVTHKKREQPPNDRDLLLHNEKQNTSTNQCCCTTSDGIIVGIWMFVSVSLYIGVWLVQNTLIKDIHEYWLINLALNLLGYLTVFLSGYATISYVQEKNYIETGRNALLYPIVKPIVFGSGGGDQTIEHTIDAEAAEHAQEQTTPPKNDCVTAVKLLLSFVGLLVTFLTWGVLQEKIMTRQVG